MSDTKNFTPGRKWKYVILFGAIAIVLAALCFVPPISQNENYHHFADTRAFGMIPNTLNVLSNAFFVIVGVLGLALVGRDLNSLHLPLFSNPAERWPYLIFFLGVTLTTFGSGYYHADPNDARLVWDRLPMTLGFMSLLSATIAERISVRSGLRSLAPLLIFGVASVLYWDFTQAQGRGDLRPYALAQFGSLVVLALLIGLFPPRYTRGYDLIISLGIYAVAKGFEFADRYFYRVGGILSGHTVKHLIAALSAFWIYRMLKLRTPVDSSETNLPIRVRDASGNPAI